MTLFTVDTINHHTRQNKFACALGLAALLVASSVSAGEGKQSRKHRGPPPAAIEACVDLALDAACRFDGRRGEVQGTCIVPRDLEDQLACAPEGGRRHHKKPEQPDAQE